MNDIGPGDWVEVIDFAENPTAKIKFDRNAIYQCESITEEIYSCECEKTHPGIVIVGMYSDHPTRSWAACSFRPIYRPKADLTTKLLQPIEDGVFNKLDRRIRSGAKR